MHVITVELAEFLRKKDIFLVFAQELNHRTTKYYSIHICTSQKIILLTSFELIGWVISLSDLH